MINFQNISKTFSSIKVLSNLTIQVPDGSTVALLGLSGSGKTTVLKLICGLSKADSGQIIIDKQTLSPESIRELRKKIGYVVQDGGLFPHLTAYGNLEIVGLEAGLSKEDIKKRKLELASLTQIAEDVLHRYPRDISGGQRQRIGIMRALLLDPPLLLLDEPFGALDPITRSQLVVDLKDIFRKMKKTVLLVTHDLYEAGFLANQIYLLNQGQVAQVGSLEQLTKNPSSDFVKLFVNAQRILHGEN
jgi:osmoprotectant transport system ATP-binding protein